MRRAHSMPFGAEIGPEGVRFALWAPTAERVALVLDGTEHPLDDQGEGWRRLTVPGVVRKAAVIGVPHPVLGAALKAVLVVEPGVELTSQAVIRHCTAHLEDFMVPFFF